MSDAIEVRRGYRNPFSQVPEDLLDRSVSKVGDKAARLWGLLDRYAGRDGQAYPSRQTLARRLECTVDTVDRAVRELEEKGWLEVQRRPGTTSLYVLLNPFDAELEGGRIDAATRSGDAAFLPDGGGRIFAAQKESQENETPPTPPEGGPRPMRVGRKVVTPAERELAVGVLAEFNRQTGTRYASEDYLRSIIARHREYPKFDLAAHGRLIKAQLADPWWKGPPSPNVIYGNAAQFERSVETARAAKQRTPLTAVRERPRLTADEATLRDLREYLAAAPAGERAQVEADIAGVEARIAAAARRAS